MAPCCLLSIAVQPQWLFTADVWLPLLRGCCSWTDDAMIVHSVHLTDEGVPISTRGVMPAIPSILVQQHAVHRRASVWFSVCPSWVRHWSHSTLFNPHPTATTSDVTTARPQHKKLANKLQFNREIANESRQSFDFEHEQNTNETTNVAVRSTVIRTRYHFVSSCNYFPHLCSYNIFNTQRSVLA